MKNHIDVVNYMIKIITQNGNTLNATVLNNVFSIAFHNSHFTLACILLTHGAKRCTHSHYCTHPWIDHITSLQSKDTLLAFNRAPHIWHTRTIPHLGAQDCASPRTHFLGQFTTSSLAACAHGSGRPKKLKNTLHNKFPNFIDSITMTDCTSSKEWAYMLKWLGRSIDQECDRPEPSNTVLCSLRMKRATASRAFEEAIQREAKEDAYSSRWNENVADCAALCGF